MYNKIGYIEYNSNENGSYIHNIINKIFNKISICDIDKDKIKILVNKQKISDKLLLKIVQLIKANEINKIVISNEIDINKKILTDNKIELLNGKKLMKNMLMSILSIIYKYNDIDMRSSEVYIAIKDDKDLKIIYELASYFRCINIVTDRIRKLNRLESKFDKNDQIIYSISSNRNKSLKRAKIIINFDYNSDFFEEFCINRSAIIINLSDSKIKMKTSFQGVVIENIDINFENYNNANFDKNILYESYIYNLNYDELQCKLIEDKCHIKGLLGANGEINKYELKVIALDKNGKKD